MIEKILLLSLPAVIEEGDTYLDDGKSFPLGLAYIAAVLRDRGISVRIVDAYVEARGNVRDASGGGWLELGLSDEEILEHIDLFGPDMIGISIPFSCQHYIALNLAQKIRERFPHIALVGGGNHVTACPEDIPAGLFDYLVLGEGERSLDELVRRLNQDEEAQAASADLLGGIYPLPPGDPIPALDELPFPAIDLLPLEKLWGKGRRWINMIATRGCVYDCIFCSIHTVMGNSIRTRSVRNVISEIEYWCKKYHIEEVYFEDDNLTFNRRWAKELFKAIAERSWGIRFYVRNGVRADSLDIEMLEAMKTAGFQEIVIAPESGSRRILKEVINKKMDLEDHIRAVELARSVNLGVNAFFVFGFAEEDWEDIHETIKFARRLQSMGCQGFWFSLATPFPGTRLYYRYKERGLFPKEIDYRRFRSVDYVIASPHFSAEEMKNFRRKVMEDFSPRNSIFRTILNAARLVIIDPRLFLMKFRYKTRRTGNTC